MKKQKHQPPVAKTNLAIDNQFTRILGYELAVIQRDLLKTILISGILIGVVIGLSFYLG
ncbi:MAG TPA: hypothetical protein VF209_03320 [Patescibacteria group bacterium]